MYDTSTYRNVRIFNYTAPSGQVVGAPSGSTNPSVQTQPRNLFLISCSGADASLSISGATLPQYVIGAGEGGQYVPFAESIKCLLTSTGSVTVVELTN
ncbi:hypothetical protein EON81_22325 [bacterium]|nr:MAG: hypothetical protein EON81_22325 [bacterium]